MPKVSKNAINDIRLNNLRLLEVELGTKAALLKSLGITDEDGLDRFFRKKKPTVVTEAFARTVEKKLKKPKEWMDRENYKLALSSEEWMLLDSYRAGTNRDRVITTTLANLLETMPEGK